jgi:hypothetical protein
LWSCPLSAFQVGAPEDRGRVSCDRYHPPRELGTEIGIANNDLESLGVAFGDSEACPGFVSIRRAGWLWLLNLKLHPEDLVPGSGIVACSEKEADAIVYRMRRIDEVRLALKSDTSDKVSVTLVKQSRPPPPNEMKRAIGSHSKSLAVSSGSSRPLRRFRRVILYH